LIAAGLVHDAVKRGTATERGVRAEMGDAIASLVMALTEDRAFESFAARKAGLRAQVMAAGPRAITIFAADKLSDIRGLRPGIDASRDSIEARTGASIAAMAGHYRESVEMIESNDPSSRFVPAPRQALEILTTPDEPE
jgi:(p)ppGpp synthase/HD superfamily hydrolase